MATPNYCSYPSLQFAKNRIKNPPESFNKNKTKYQEKAYEHHVASWALTMLKEVFTGPEWIITPERKDPNSGKKPDLVVEKVTSHASSKVHLIMELKSSIGDRFEEALAQAVAEIEEEMENQIEVYVVIQRGTKIGFFEYHNDKSNLGKAGITHFKGCVSLTHNYSVEGQQSLVLNNLPINLDLLYHNTERLRVKNSVRDQAEMFKQPCVFDLDLHEEEINFPFHHMLTTPARSSV